MHAKKIELSEHFLIGHADLSVFPQRPFSPMICQFLEELYQEIWSTTEAHQYSDLMSLAFYFRPANLRILASRYPEAETRRGLGLALHIAAGNVPTGFAYSFLFGLLSGNSNLVRVPSRSTPQRDLFLKTLSTVLWRRKFERIKDGTAFYEMQADIDSTSSFSIRADARLIWGSDPTVQKIRDLPKKMKTVDLCFGDRYSVCVIDLACLSKQTDAEMQEIVLKFYNDTYALDQAACSSPSFVFWVGEGRAETQSLFWEKLESITRNRYAIQPLQVIDKLNKFCLDAQSLEIEKFYLNGPQIFRTRISEASSNLMNHRGESGYFYELQVPTLEHIDPFIKSSCQTMTYFGFESDHIKNWIVNAELVGIDRVVPLGSALEMGLLWDGYDVIRSLSRVIQIL